MNKYLLKIIATLSFVCVCSVTFAQQTEMADMFRAEGKIYVVIGVFAIIMLVMFIYLFMMDRKIRQLENRINANED